MTHIGIPRGTIIRIGIRNLRTSASNASNSPKLKRNNEKLDESSKHLIDNDDALLESIMNDDGLTDPSKSNNPPPLGPKYWRHEYGKQLKTINKTIESTLEQHLKRNMDVIKSYNEVYKQAPIERIKVDPAKTDATFSDYYDNMVLLKCIESYLGSKKPTEFQKRLFALTKSNLSSISKGDQGTGKTLAIIIHSLFLNRARRRGPGINSLIIVKSTELVIRYQQIINGIYSNLPVRGNKKGSISQLAQFMYRSDQETESEQQSILANYPTPHILVTTPHRLLDLLSTRGMDYIKVNSLSFIAVDDFDNLIDPHVLLETKKDAPVVQLLNYVLKLQDYKRQHNEPHPQIVFTVSSSVSDSLLEQIKGKTMWFDWNKFVQLGFFESETELPYSNYFPSNVSISSVLIQPQLNSKNNKMRISLYDMTKFEYGKSMKSWLDKLFRTLKGNDLSYLRHRKLKRAKMTPDMKVVELDILLGGLIKLLKKKNSKDLKSKKFLIVHPDEINGLKIQKLLTKSRKTSKIFNLHQDLDFFTIPLKEGNDTQFLTINTSSLPGMTFKGLDTIILLGMDSIKSVSNFVTIGGRFRDLKTGLVDDKLYPTFGEDNSVNNTDNGKSNKIIILNSKMDFENMERNYLERLMLRSGLIPQFDSVGVNEIDFNKNLYLSEFTSDYSFELDDEVNDVELDDSIHVDDSIIEYSEELEKNYKE